MKIYLCGSTSVGKSTLAAHISKKYSLPLIPEVARTILIEKDLKLDKLRTNLSAVNEFQTEILTRQIEQEKNLTAFVSDRSLDCLSYFAEYSTVFSDTFNSKQCQEYFEKLKQSENIIFFIRPHLHLLEDDGIREKPIWENVLRIDGMIKMLLQINKLRYFQIDSSNMQERMSLVDAVLSLAKDANL